MCARMVYLRSTNSIAVLQIWKYGADTPVLRQLAAATLIINQAHNVLIPVYFQDMCLCETRRFGF